MATERYVLLGLGTTRSPWFTEVARWATAGSLPADFVKCISAEELRVRLGSGRAFSAVLVDVGTGAVDRDLLDLAARHHAAVLVVDGTGDRDWIALGASAVLPADLRRQQLLDVLQERATMIGGPSDLAVDPAADGLGRPEVAAAPLVAVTGSGGAGASTLAMAAAQGLARAEPGADVLLADLCLDAEAAMLHDARDVVPGLQELVEAHRTRRPARTEVRGLTFDVVTRGYHLLLGLRRHRDWTVLKPRTFEAALDGVRAAFGTVVADIDPDVEGEARCGSIEVEERNVMARTVATRADVVVVVGAPGVKGLHSLVRTVDELTALGVEPHRLLPVVNRSLRTARGRAELTRAFAELAGARTDGPALVGPVHLPDRRGLDDALRDGARLPTALAEPLAGAIAAVLERTDRHPARRPSPPSRSCPGPSARGPRRRWPDDRGRPPSLEIEQAVLDRAKGIALDMGDADGNRRLRGLVEEEVAQWSADHKRGLRAFDLSDPEAVVERALRNLCGYGPLAPLLADDDVWEVMINAPDEIFVKRHMGSSGYHDEVFHDDAHVVRTLTKVIDDASGAHRKLDAAEGLQDAQLDNGSRLHIVHQDIARGGHVMVNIRKFTGVVFRNLDQLVDRGMLTRQVAAFLKACVRSQASIVFAGAPGSGKTTMLSCCAAELDPRLRVVTAEEVFEVDIPLPNVASMQTRGARPERPAVDLRRLVSGFLRMAPDVAIVGEVRDREALPLLLTLSSGVKGFTTIHAGSARQALSRLRFICQLSDNDLPLTALNSLVTEAVDVVVHCARTPHGPEVTEVLAVEDLSASPDGTAFTVTPLFTREGAGGPLAWTGQRPQRLERPLRDTGHDLRRILDDEPDAEVPRPADASPVGSP